MKLSALNQIKGKVSAIKEGMTTDHVQVDLGHGILVTSALTREAHGALQLKEGDEVTVAIGEANVILGK
jgi:molybdopterin-binding protein